jgi:hypothetical protein
MLIENERSANTMPPLRDRDNNLSLSYDCFEKADNCFSEETVLVLKSVFRSLPRLRDSLRKFESSHILTSVIITY